MSPHKLGWVPDRPDRRDFLFSVPRYIKLPPSVDLRKSGYMPPIVDQGQLGSCTANAIAGAFEFDLAKQALADFKPSRLFIYYNERVLEGTIQSDAGAMIRDGFKTIARQGVCSESVWSYAIQRFADKPSPASYNAAVANKAVKYRAVKQLAYSLKYVVAQGFPVVVGFSVYESFESDQVANNGIVPLPSAGESQLGGHAVCVVGYEKLGKVPYFICRNSWGKGWADAGYFYLPEKYLADPNLAADFWTVQAVS